MANPSSSPLESLSDDKLARRKKNRFIVASVLLGIMLIAFVAGLYDEIVTGDDKNNYLIFGFGILPASAYFLRQYKLAKDELQRRKGQANG